MAGGFREEFFVEHSALSQSLGMGTSSGVPELAASEVLGADIRWKKPKDTMHVTATASTISSNTSIREMAEEPNQRAQ